MDLPVNIVDDDPAVRESLRMMLEAAGYLVRTFSQARQFLSDADLEHGCLVVDIRMPGMSGLELQQELTRRDVSMPVIVVTGHGDVPLAVQAMGAGAVDFIEKPFDKERMLSSVMKALRLGVEIRDRETEIKAARNLLGQLTPRERSVLDELVLGHQNKIVAHKLGISSRTVELHRSRIMDKLNARNLSDLVRTSLAVKQPGAK